LEGSSLRGDLDDGALSQLIEGLAGEMDRLSDRKRRISGYGDRTDSLVEGGIDPSLFMPPELVIPPELVAEVTYLTWAAASVLRMVY